MRALGMSAKCWTQGRSGRLRVGKFVHRGGTRNSEDVYPCARRHPVWVRPLGPVASAPKRHYFGTCTSRTLSQPSGAIVYTAHPVGMSVEFRRLRSVAP